MLPLLVHSEDLSEDLRKTIRQALVAPPEQRRSTLEATARAIYREVSVLESAGLECADVKALVGL